MIMSKSLSPDDRLLELHVLATASLKGEASDEQAARLEQLVCEDQEFRKFYVQYMYASWGLKEWAKQPLSNTTEEQLSSSIEDASAIESEGVINLGTDNLPSAIGFPVLNTNSTASIHSSLFAFHSSYGHFLLSYAVASLIFGILLLGTWTWRSLTDRQISVGISGQTALDTNSRSQKSSVGHVTGLANCRGRYWSAANGQWLNIQNQYCGTVKRQCFLGDQFALTSGLMQITYDTGAVVLLQGPCTYQIESTRSGYLAMGKLTARVQSPGSRVQSQTGQQEHTRLLALDSRLFAVRTPTAIVTDLGTEFGVEVEQSGTTSSYVFQGKVELVPLPESRGAVGKDRAIILIANESARVKRDWNNNIEISRKSIQPSRFVRLMPDANNSHHISPPTITNSNGIGWRHDTTNRETASPVARRPSVSYRLTDLRGVNSRAFDMNAAGHVVGYAASEPRGVVHAFLYAGGNQLLDLGESHNSKSMAVGINASGEIVGVKYDAHGKANAVLFRNGKLIDLGTLGGTMSCAMGINDAGVVVGQSDTAEGIQHTFIHTRERGMVDLGAMYGFKKASCPADINSAGQIVGCLETDGRKRAFLYTPGQGIKVLGTLGGDTSDAHAINDLGQVVGFSKNHKGEERAFLYTHDDGMKEIGRPKTVSYGLDINNHGQIVGRADGLKPDHDYTRAFFYDRGQYGQLTAEATDWTLLSASVINDSGQIAGFGKAPDGKMRAYLLTPQKRN